MNGESHPRNASAASCLRSASPLTASVSRACRAAVALCSPGHRALVSCITQIIMSVSHLIQSVSHFDMQ